MHVDLLRSGAANWFRRAVVARGNEKLLSTSISNCGSRLPHGSARSDADFAALMDGMLALSHEKDAALHLPVSVDHRIQRFLSAYLKDAVEAPRLPFRPLCSIATVSPRPFAATGPRSTHDGYRLLLSRSTGVLHTRRATAHDAGHLSRLRGRASDTDDKKRSPSRFWTPASPCIAPAGRTDALPFTATQAAPADACVALLRPWSALRSTASSRRSRWRFASLRLAAWSATSTSLKHFGNGGDPVCRERRRARPITGRATALHHPGAAPHRLTSRNSGFRAGGRDGTSAARRMCWRDPAERYNDGVAFK